MKKLFFCCIFLIFLILSGCDKSKSDLNNLASKKAISRLVEGNKRFANNKSLHPNQDERRRKEIAQKQSPFAVIVGCADSRVPPEIIFDEGLGDLFVVRVAGNVIGPIELESIEYGVFHLNSAVVLVLGHENCGAVDAVLKNDFSDIENIAKFISPAVKDSEKLGKNNELEAAIKQNAINMKDFLENSSKINQAVHDKKIEVHAAYYNLESGLVEFLEK